MVYVTVGNAFGRVTSSNANLYVTNGLSITSQPQSQTVAAGSSATFTVAAAGAAPLNYQWQFNGTNLSGATSTSLTLTGVQPANAGSYTVVVTNSAGSTTSAAAVLTVLPGAGTLVINGAQTYQVIDGFGVNANHRSWNNNELQPVLDALIDQAGITIFHVIFDNNNWEQTNDNSDPDTMNWSYYDTIYSDAEFQKMWGIMGYINQKGITNGLVPDFEGPVATWMGGLSLTPGMEPEYAETIVSLLVYACRTQNLKFTTVGPVNEPDNTYAGINLTGSAQYVTVMDDIINLLNANGLTSINFSGPDLAYTQTSWLSAVMGDSTLMSRLAHWGLHYYENASTDPTGVYSFIQSSAYPNTHFWMTEYGVWCSNCQGGVSGDSSWTYAQNTASLLLHLLAEGASGCVIWEGYDSQYVAFNPSTGGNDPPAWSFWGLMAVNDVNATPKTYSPRPTFYTVAQIAKFVRPGAQRISVSGASTPLTLVAFYNTNNGAVHIERREHHQQRVELIMRADVAAGHSQFGSLLHLKHYEPLLRRQRGSRQRRLLGPGAGGLCVHADLLQRGSDAGGTADGAYGSRPANSDHRAAGTRRVPTGHCRPTTAALRH